MARNSAQLLLLIAAFMGPATTACVLPPYLGEETNLGPYPPQVDRETLTPKAALTQLWTRCESTDSIQLAAEFTDLDTPVLNHRWVANNGVSNTVWLEDDQTNRPEQGPHVESLRLQHSADFGFDPNVENFTGVVSLFTTDGPAEAWAVDPNSVTPGEPRDLGIIANPNNQFSVIEVRWTFEYLEEQANVCQPAD